MTTSLIEQGFSEIGIQLFISTIESVLPHTPGNWEFRSDEEKLNFFYNNKRLIYGYLAAEKSKCEFSIFHTDLTPEQEADEFKASERFSKLASANSTLVGMC